MLLLFWNGIQDSVGTIASVATLLGDGIRIAIGAGSIACVSTLSGDGTVIRIGVGSIDCISLLLGIGIVRLQDTTYIFTIAGQNGEAYSVAAADGLAHYLSTDVDGRVEYRHKPIGRVIP